MVWPEKSFSRIAEQAAAAGLFVAAEDLPGLANQVLDLSVRANGLRTALTVLDEAGAPDRRPASS